MRRPDRNRSHAAPRGAAEWSKIVALTCRNVQHVHDAYLDADLPASMIAEVDAHLLQCPECQRQIEMVRVCGNVISRDQSEPRAADDFAARVLTALPRREVVAPAPAVPLTRRQRRRIVFERIAAGFIPAMAAMIALSVLVFPVASERSPGPDRQSGKVLGESASRDMSPAMALGVQGIVDPTLNSIDQASRAVGNLQDFANLTLRDARDELAASARPASASPDDSLSGAFLMQMLHPLLNVVSPVPTESAPAPADDVVRF